MGARSIFLLVLLSLIVGCSSLHHRQEMPTKGFAPTVKSSTQTRVLPTFNRVKIDGNINVKIRTGAQRSTLIIHGDPRDVAYLTTSVQGGQLHLNLGSGYPQYGAMFVEINTRYLNAFEYHGAGIIQGYIKSSLLDLLIENQGKTTLQGQMGVRNLTLSGDGYVELLGINSPALVMKLSGKPRLKLAGMIGLTQLDMKGSAWLSLYWVKSNLLTVRAHDKAFIQLGGKVNRLEVELWDRAHFNGRYLRADRAFVKTHQHAIAEMSAVKRQHTLATDQSDIRFYNIPTMKADFMAFDGAVLDMRDLRSPFVQEYDQYNK